MLRVLFVLLGVLCRLSSAGAHDSPEHSIDELTEHIRQNGATSSLLLRRASHYRVLGQPDRAVADLKRVLLLEPKHQGAQVELSRIYLAQNQLDLALRSIQQAINAAQAGQRSSAHLYAVRAEIYDAKADYVKALADYDRAIAGDAAQVDWYLNRARLHQRLNQPEERIKGLLQGHVSTLSAVLHVERIEAMIDGGYAQQALQLIEPALQHARLKSSWRIRRARALSALNDDAEYSAAIRDELESALAEINVRLRPTRPDIELLLDRALIYLLSDDEKFARSDIARARENGATPRQLERVLRLLQ